MNAPASTSSGCTPILDFEEPLPAPLPPTSAPGIGRSVGVGVLVAALVLAVVYSPTVRSWISVDREQWSSGLWIASLVGSLVVAVPAAIAIHEIGHALGGVCAGLRFESLRVGPLQIDRSLRVSIHRGSNSGYGGWAILTPATLEGLRARMAVMVVAGPAANLLSGAVLLFLPTRGFLASMFVAVSFLLGMRELLPIRDPIAVRDGRRLWMLFLDRPAGGRWLAMVALGAAIRAGAMPETWPAEQVEQAVALADDSPDTVLAHAFAYSAALHRKEDLRAALMLETCLRHSSRVPALREGLFSDAAVFQARRRGSVDMAQRWMDLLPEAPEQAWLRQRVEAAILEAQGEFDRALDKLAEYETSLRALQNRSQAEILLRLLDRWKSELRAALTSAGCGAP